MSTTQPDRSLDEIRADIDAARAKHRRLTDEAEPLALDEGALSGGKRTRWENLLAGAKNAADEIRRLEDEWRDKIQRGLDNGTLALEPSDGTLDGQRGAAQRRNRGTDKVHGDALRALERSSFVDDDRRGYVAELLERSAGSETPDYRFAAWATAATDDNYLEAFRQVIADPVAGHLKLTEAQRASIAQVAQSVRAMSTTDAAGGYMSLPLALDPAVRLSNNGALNPLGTLASVTILDAPTDTWRSPYTAGVTASWDGEGGTVSDDSPTISAADVKAWKWQAFTPFSIEIQMDAQQFAREMAAMLDDSADRLEASAFMSGSGDGSNQPNGLVTALDANTNVEVVVTTDGAFGLVDVFKLHKNLPARWRVGGRAAWLATIGTIDHIRQLVMAQASGASLWSEIDAASPPLLLGHPIYEVTAGLTDFVGTTTAANLMVLGDFKDAYKVVRRAPTQIELVPHLVDVTNNRPTGQRGFYAWGRSGGGTIVDVAARLLQNQ